MNGPDGRIKIDKQDINYQLGAIITRIDGQNGQLKELTKSIGTMTKTIGKLPCSIHTERIKNLEDAGTSEQETEQQQMQNKLTFRQGLILTGITALIATGTTLLASFLF